MLNLKTKGIDNAAAVLGGYDALVQAGFPVEKGKPQPRPAQAASATASSIKPPQQHGDEAATSAEPTTARAAKPAARAKRAVKRQKAKH